MRQRLFATMGLVAMLTGACSSAAGLLPYTGFGVVVVYQSEEGSTTKEGLDATSETGVRLFGPSGIDPPKPGTHHRDIGTSGYSGGGVPQWVRVTWRKDTTPGKYWSTGTVTGDYKIEVASRIPPEVLKYVREEKGRALRLIFRIRDDGVGLAWDVQESEGGGWVYSLHGGDFPCNPVSPNASGSNCTAGLLKDTPWWKQVDLSRRKAAGQ